MHIVGFNLHLCNTNIQEIFILIHEVNNIKRLLKFDVSAFKCAESFKKQIQISNFNVNKFSSSISNFACALLYLKCLKTFLNIF